MKKFTLTLMAAFLAVGGGFSQKIEGAEKAPLKEYTEIPAGTDFASLRTQFAAKQNNAPRKGTAVAPYYVVDGAYTWVYQQVTSTSDTWKSKDVVIRNTGTFTEGKQEYSQVTIDGADLYLDGYAYPLEAVVYPDGKFKILDSQRISPTYTSGYYYMLTAIDDNNHRADITGTIDERAGVITLDDDYILLCKRSNNASSLYYPMFVYNEFTRDAHFNGLMEATRSNGIEVYPVVLSQKGNEVSVENFAGLGQTVKILLQANNKIVIPQQFAYTKSGTDFYTYGVDDWSSWTYTDDINGTFTVSEISWGDFSIEDDNNWYWLNKYFGAKVYYVNGSCERYNYTGSSAASAPRFAFGSESTGISSAKTGAEVASERYVDVAGREVTAATKGLVIKTTTFADGTKKTQKVINR